MRRRIRRLVVSCVALALLASPLGRTIRGDEPTVVRVAAVQEAGEEWTFAVTVRHADRRVLLHSHVDEQPFTRDARVRIPTHVHVVVVEAHDKVHGLGGATTVDLREDAGPRYRVRRAH